jgi:long-chain acyl-CoA synthetase
MRENFVAYLEGSIRDNWALPAFSDYEAASLTYGDVASHIYRLHAIFEECGLARGGKVALLGRNSANWAITYLAVVSYGAVIVPILPDFHPSDFENIIVHSDSALLFVTPGFYEKLGASKFTALKAVFSLADFSLLDGSPGARPAGGTNTGIAERAGTRFAESYLPRLSPGAFRFAPTPGEDLAAIIYTSGTTGFSKGVMLSHGNFISNLVYAQENVFLKPRDTILSFLPLAHSFGCAFEFIFPFSRGCHITFLNRIPTTKVLIEAFAAVKPRLVLSVPLVIEKIYYKQLRPLLSSPRMKVLLKVPIVRGVIYRTIRKKLTGFFGGNVLQVIIGGASFNSEVEDFLKRVRFPFTIGYGMTECGPLISYIDWKTHRKASVGRLVDRMEFRIEHTGTHEPGEICVRGANVMMGYYKNPEETALALDQERWLHTGDLGSIDDDGFIFIRGRSKTMILSSSGQNIYPEEIEAKLNTLPLVAESLVLDDHGTLSALVYPDFPEAEKQGVPNAALAERMEQNRQALNKQLPEYTRIASIAVHNEEFAKTPTNKIKRFLYAVK